jgi:hypothetical protein
MLKDTATGKAMIAEERARVEAKATAAFRRLLATALRRFGLPARSPVIRAIPASALEDTLNRLMLAETASQARAIVGLPEARTRNGARAASR